MSLSDLNFLSLVLSFDFDRFQLILTYVYLDSLIRLILQMREFELNLCRWLGLYSIFDGKIMPLFWLLYVNILLNESRGSWTSRLSLLLQDLRDYRA